MRQAIANNNQGLKDWWGFRLRSHECYDPPPVSRVELLSFGLFLSIVLNFIWMTKVIITTTITGHEIDSILDPALYIPLLCAVVPPLLFLFIPQAFAKKMLVSDFMIACREKGGIGSWDAMIAVLTIISLIWGLFKYPIYNGEFVAFIWFAISTILMTLSLYITPAGVIFKQRSWDFTLPDWMREELDGEEPDGVPDRKKRELPGGPEDGADPIYKIDCSGTIHEIGICITDDSIEKLRKINRESEGRLFHEDIKQVVLVDRQAAMEVGPQKLKDLCRQIFFIAQKESLTRYQVANLVLNMVQTEISYKLDIDSTANFEGGAFEEYGRFALETMKDEVGDCECTAIMAASILAYLGFETALLLVEVIDPETEQFDSQEKEGRPNHAAVGIKKEGSFLASGISFDTFKTQKGVEYLYGETAIDGSIQSFGAIPEGWENWMKPCLVDEIGLPKS